MIGELMVSLALAAAPASATTHTYGSVVGSARQQYVVPEDDVRVSISAVGEFDRASPSPTSVRAWGTVRISHYIAQLDVTWWAVGTVDCVSIGGRYGVVSAIIDRTSPELESWLDKRVGLSVTEAGPGEPGRTGRTAPKPPDQLDACAAPAPVAPLLRGGYTVNGGS